MSVVIYDFEVRNQWEFGGGLQCVVGPPRPATSLHALAKSAVRTVNTYTECRVSHSFHSFGTRPTICGKGIFGAWKKMLDKNVDLRYKNIVLVEQNVNFVRG